MKEYLNKVSQKIEGRKIKINKLANSSKYLPIAYVEEHLDVVFDGSWGVENFQWQVIANEVVGSLELVYTHPETNQLIRRVGVASVMIQQAKGSNLGDINSKIKNTLVKDFPHLKAECIKNAAKSVGVFFGRDLNREMEDSAVNDYANYQSKIDKAKTIEELNRIWVNIPSFLHEDCKSFFTEKKKELKGGAKM